MDKGDFMKILTFTLNDVNFGIPIETVEFIGSIGDKMSIQTMSDMPDYIMGIVMLYGTSVPVYSLALMFGFAGLEIKNLVVINIDEVRWALGIDGDGEIIDVEEKEIFPLPACIGTRHYLKNVVTYRHNQLILLIDINRLVQ